MASNQRFSERQHLSRSRRQDAAQLLRRLEDLDRSARQLEARFRERPLVGKVLVCRPTNSKNESS